MMGYVNLSGVPVVGVLFIKKNKRQIKGDGQSFSLWNFEGLVIIRLAGAETD
jgi:hypothetical protein